MGKRFLKTFLMVFSFLIGVDNLARFSILREKEGENASGRTCDGGSGGLGEQWVR